MEKTNEILNKEDIKIFYLHLCSMQGRNINLDWNTYFLLLAKLISLKSPDTQTKHGTVIVKDKRILGCGFNGYPAGLKYDFKIPVVRPDKYPWMIHSEVNAVSNCVLRPEGGTAYVTGEPCNNCLLTLWQNGVRLVRHIDSHGSYLIDEKERKFRDEFLWQSEMKLEKFDLDN